MLCTLGQNLVATRHKTAAVRLLGSHVNNHSSKVNTTCRAQLGNNELISDVYRLLYIAYLHRLCVDSRCSLEDPPGAMEDVYN